MFLIKNICTRTSVISAWRLIHYPFLQEEATGWLAPGEGYTPEPMEYQYLTELEAKLKVVISDEDYSPIQSSLSNIPKEIYQVW